MKKNGLCDSHDPGILKKTLRAMRLTMILIFGTLFTVNASNTYSQSTYLSVRFTNCTILDVFNYVEENSEFIFLYRNEELNINRKMNVNLKNATIQKILDEVLEGQDVKYEIYDRQVIIRKSDTNDSDNPQFNKELTGIVTDSEGVPLPGVSILVKGTTIGVVTDSEGNFVLRVPDNAQELQISFVGMKTQTISIAGNTNFIITMEDDSIGLDEVVAVGYGTVRKSDLTGSLVSLSNEKFKDLPQGSVTQILQGKAAGVNITSTSGSGNANIRIRGITSLNKSSEPLWVVDGVIGGTIGNFYDIESIEILKDASSTAIYGSQGANGVILVTTKKPQTGMNITMDARFGWKTMRNKPDMLSPYEYATALNDVFGTGTVSETDVAAYKAGTKGIDWIDLMTQTGFSQNYNLNISGGNDKTKYSVTGWGGDTKGQWLTVTSRDYNLKATLNSEITPWFNLSGYLYGGVSKSHNGTNQGQFSSVIEYSPCMELQDEDGVYILDPYGSLSRNPYASVKAEYSDSERSDMDGFVDFNFKIIDGLTLSLQGFYTRHQNLYRSFRSTKAYPNAQNYATNQSDQSYRWRNINNLTYQKDIGEHRLTAMAVLETTKYEWSRLSGTSYDLVNEQTGYWDLGSAETQQVGNDYTGNQMVSTFGRLIYSYKSKYLFTGTFRADAPSQFKDKNKWGYFPSVALGWNIAEEPFMNKDLIQQLKLRASVGSSGNHGVGAYATYAMLTRDYVSYGTSQQYFGYWPEEFSNPDLRWEKTLQYDLGFDLSILDQKVSLTTDVFLKKTTDLLFQKELPDYNGGGRIWTNQGEIHNKGLEFTLNVIPVQSKNFTWESNLTATYTQNIVKDLGDVNRIVPDASRGGMYQGGIFVLEVDKPVGSFYLQEWAGFNDEGANLYVTADGGLTTENNTEDKKVMGNSIPNWIFGWNNSFKYKNWDMNIFFRATGKYDRLNLSRYVQSCMVGASRFISTREAYYRSWDKVSDKSEALFPSLTNSNNQYVAGSTQWLEDAAFIRCQNLTVGYTIPEKLTKIGKVHLSLSAENLFVLTKYKGMDPETVSEVSSSYYDTTFGLDNGSFPLPRTFMFMIRFNY